MTSCGSDRAEMWFAADTTTESDGFWQDTHRMRGVRGPCYVYNCSLSPDLPVLVMTLLAALRDRRAF
jgi:hypothetical protein